MDSGHYAPSVKVTGRKLFTRFSEEICPKRRGCRWEQVRIKRFLKEMAFLNKEASKITRLDIHKWKEHRLTVDQVANSTVNREMNLISSIFTTATREFHLNIANPCKQVKRAPPTKARKRRISEAEILSITAQFDWDIGRKPRKGWGAGRDSVPWIFLLAIETGMRLSEICTLTWDQVFERHVHLDRSKNGDERDVPLTARARELFKALGGGVGDVFHPSAAVVGEEFRDALKKAGIEGLHFHDSRHEACSRLAKKLTAMELAAAIGHRDLKSLMIYYNPTAAELSSKLD